MQTSHLRRIILLSSVIAFWPVWRWYFLRLSTSVEELTGLISILSAILLNWFNLNSANDFNGRLQLLLAGSMFKRTSIQSTNIPIQLIILIIIYILTYPFAPPLIRAFIAFNIVIIVIFYLYQLHFHWGIWGLFMLGLPVIPSLQFFCGFPLRWLVTFCTVPLINMSGFPVIQEGTCLNWAGKLIMVDLPCSGIKMLWSGIYLALILTSLFNFKLLKTGITLLISVGIIILGNIFRAVSLFYTESGIVKLPDSAHTGIGLVSFLLVSILIFMVTVFLRRYPKCSDSTPL